MDFTKYKNNTPVFQKPRKPSMAANPTIAEAEDYISKLKEFEKLEVQHLESMKAYRNEEGRLRSLFISDLFSENGIDQGNTISWEKANIIYNEAYQSAHAGGYEEIANKFVDLLDFARQLGVTL